MAVTPEPSEFNNQGIRVREARTCYLCAAQGVLTYSGLRDRLFSAPGVWSLLRCPVCDLVWLNPRPVLADLMKLYAEYFTHEPKRTESRLAGVRQLMGDLALPNLLDYTHLVRVCPGGGLVWAVSRLGPLREMVEMSVMTLRWRPGGKLLDVGCGNGVFLAKMRDLGWDVVGLEPDHQAAEIARKAFGLTVYEGSIEETSLPAEAFDAVTLSHVIEHTLDPVAVLRECRRVLKSGGVLVAVTPNRNSLGRRFFGPAWVHWDPPRHVYAFTKSTLGTLIERAGLEILRLRTASRAAASTWMASWRIRRDAALPHASMKGWRVGTLLMGLGFQLLEYVVSRIADLGEELVLVARK